MASSPRSGSSALGVEVVAAGALVIRKKRGERQVLLVHRPKYDDWSFPKGKQDPGEHVTATAVREVWEETRVPIRLGRPLLPQLYADAKGRTKKVHYWVGHLTGDAEPRVPDGEVDEVAWVSLDKALRRLTYRDDIDVLDDLHDEPRRTTPLIVLRHADAVARDGWEQPDPLRPLTAEGHEHAEALAPVLSAYGVRHIVTSASVRCAQTVEPFARTSDLPMEATERLSEEAFDEIHAREHLDAALGGRTPYVFCVHRPQLPRILAMLGVDEEPLAKGEMVVCHHRKGRILATERHFPG